MKPRIYLAGPCSGLPEDNYPAFHAEAARLRSISFIVENPAENPAPTDESWLAYMRMAITQLVTCDTWYDDDDYQDALNILESIKITHKFSMGFADWGNG